MSRLAAFIILAVALAACGLADALIHGWEQAKAVEKDLETATGMMPKVGFNWVNGRLVTVTVTFPELYEAKPLNALADIVQRSVVTEFKQAPGEIVLGFSLPTIAPGTRVELRGLRSNAAKQTL